MFLQCLVCYDNQGLCGRINLRERYRENQCIVNQHTYEFSNGSLCSSFKFLQFLSDVSLQIPVRFTWSQLHQILPSTTTNVFARWCYCHSLRELSPINDTRGLSHKQVTKRHHLLIYKIWKIRDTLFVGNLFLSTNREFHYDDVN